MQVSRVYWLPYNGIPQFDMLTIVFLIAAVFPTSEAATAFNNTTTKPHIVFVLVDDWGFADVSFRNPAPTFKSWQTQASSWDAIMHSSTALPPELLS